MQLSYTCANFRETDSRERMKKERGGGGCGGGGGRRREEHPAMRLSYFHFPRVNG